MFLSSVFLLQYSLEQWAFALSRQRELPQDYLEPKASLPFLFLHHLLRALNLMVKGNLI